MNEILFYNCVKIISQWMFIICGWGRSEGVDPQHWWTNFIVLLELWCWGLLEHPLGQMSLFSPQFSVVISVQDTTLCFTVPHSDWLTVTANWLPEARLTAEVHWSLLMVTLTQWSGGKQNTERETAAVNFWLLRWTTCSSSSSCVPPCLPPPWSDRSTKLVRY